MHQIVSGPKSRLRRPFHGGTGGQNAHASGGSYGLICVDARDLPVESRVRC